MHFRNLSLVAIANIIFCCNQIIVKHFVLVGINQTVFY